jgi:hypothetical protein
MTEHEQRPTEDDADETVEDLDVPAADQEDIAGGYLKIKVNDDLGSKG